MHTGESNRRAFLTLEAIAATVIVIEALALFALFMTYYLRDTDVIQTQQRAGLAAEAVMNEIRAGQQPVPAEVEARLGVAACEITRQPASGTWAGFERVRVRVTAKARNGAAARVQLEGYVREVHR